MATISQTKKTLANRRKVLDEAINGPKAAKKKPAAKKKATTTTTKSSPAKKESKLAASTRKSKTAAEIATMKGASKAQVKKAAAIGLKADKASNKEFNKRLKKKVK